MSKFHNLRSVNFHFFLRGSNKCYHSCMFKAWKRSIKCYKHMLSNLTRLMLSKSVYFKNNIKELPVHHLYYIT